MNLQPRLLRFVNRFYKRELDPRRAGQIWREYDEDRHGWEPADQRLL